MTTLSFSQLNEEQKRGAILQVFRFNRNFNFPPNSPMRGVYYENEEAIRNDAEQGLLDTSFVFGVNGNEISSYALIPWDTIKPEDLKWAK